MKVCTSKEPGAYLTDVSTTFAILFTVNLKCKDLENIMMNLVI